MGLFGRFFMLYFKTICVGILPFICLSEPFEIDLGCVRESVNELIGNFVDVLVMLGECCSNSIVGRIVASSA